MGPWSEKYCGLQKLKKIDDGEIEVEGIRALVHFNGDSIDAQRLCRLAESATEEIDGCSCTRSGEPFILTNYADLDAIHALEHLIFFAIKRRLHPKLLTGMTKPLSDDEKKAIYGIAGICFHLVPWKSEDALHVRRITGEVIGYCNRLLRD